MKTISSITGLITLFLFLFLNALPGSALAIPKAPEPDSAGKARIVENYGKLPLSFEKNQGQTDEKVGFLARGGGYTLFLTPDEAVFALSSPLEDEGLGDRQKDALQVSRPEKQKMAKSAVIRMKFSGANPAPVISGQERLQETSNYFIGNDPSKWRTRISKYAKVRYREVYPGIDLVFYGNQRRLEYDFVVSPGSDPSKIRLEFQGAEEVSLDEKGNLVLRLKDGEVIQQAPVIYQEVNGKRVDVAGGYLIDHKGGVGFKVASWDRQRPLVIDPVLVYSTFLGGSNNNNCRDIVIDSSGNAYVTGWTDSSDFPTANALYPNRGGSRDAFIFKLSADGSQAVYSTYLGGTMDDYGRGIAIDSSGNACVTGHTGSTDFPTINALYPTYSGGYRDAFIFKLSADGSQAVYSTYCGGSSDNRGCDIAVDSSGNAYVTGYTRSTDFPTINALYPTHSGGYWDAFIFKLSADGSQAVYSTYLGGSSDDRGDGIAIDSSGNAYVTGFTYSSNFPTVNALYPNLGGSEDAFIFKLSADGSQAVYSTYLGGSSDDCSWAIAIDSSGNAYVTGFTYSSNFPTVNALYPNLGGSEDAFIFKLSADGSQAVYSTYLGGSSDDCSWVIAIDGSGNAYVTGRTESSDFPTVNALYPNRGGFYDAFIFKLSADGSQAVYSTYLGGSSDDRGNGIAVDGSGNAYVTGFTKSSDFPTVNALYPNLPGPWSAFIAKISDGSGSFRVETINPQSSESFYDSFFSKPDPAGLASGGSLSTTIAADGESRLLLRFFSNEPVSVTVAVEGADPANGSLSDLNGYLNAGWDDTSVTVSVDHPYGEGYVGYSVYRAPRDFTIPGCEDKLTRPASLAINHPGGTETLSLTIRRPPILLSHGIWSSPDALEDFKNDLWNRFSDTGGKNIDDFIRANDGRLVNAANFDKGADKTKSNIRDYLKDLRQRGSTVTQVDYMGHSMGGIWGRLVKQNYPWDVFTYDKGYINKIITVDTPHLGSFLADLGDIIFDAAPDYYIFWGSVVVNIKDVLCTISSIVAHPMCDGAVEDLTTEGCVDWLEAVYMPSHAVVGNKYIDTACLLLDLEDLAKLFKVMEMILKVINPDWGCENWINLLDVPTYTDYVVSLTSQKGGLVEPFEVSEFNMWHMGCYNEDVNGEVLALLNTSVDNPVFADHFDAAGDLVSLEYLMNLERLKQEAQERSARPRAPFSVDAGIAFVTPSGGEVISPGDTVVVEITTTGGLTLESLLVIDPYSDPVDITSPPYTTSFNVPLDAHGSYSLTVLGEGTDGELYGAEVTLDVDNPATLVSLEVSPKTLFIDTGGAVGISVMGEFTDGSLRDLSKGSTGTTYESGNIGIVPVDANGTCTGISAGTADVTVRHGAQPAVTVAVEVAQPYINAAFTADKYVGPVPLAVNFTDISAGYIDQWQWSFGDDGTSTDRSPSHTYSYAGNYTVTLTVTGPGGSDSDTEVIVVTGVPNIAVDPSSHDFGPVAVGATSGPETFTVSNTGAADLDVGVLSLTGADAADFAVQNDSCSNSTLAPSGNCALEVVFSPASEGSKSAALSIPSNDPDTPFLDVPLGGTGVSGGEPVPDIDANGDDGPLLISHGENLTITVSLACGDRCDEDADWWAAATSPFGLYWFTLDSGWIRSDTPIRVYGGPLFDLSPFTILEMSTLPVGNYTFYFAVDDNMDGVLNATYLDFVPVTVQ